MSSPRSLRRASQADAKFAPKTSSEPKYIEILRYNAPTKGFNRRKIEARIKKLVSNYYHPDSANLEMPALDGTDLGTNCGTKTIPEGKAHVRAALKNIGKLRTQMSMLRQRNYRDVFWFLGAATESILVMHTELDRRNSEIWEMVKGSKDRFAIELIDGVDLFADILTAAERELDKLGAIFSEAQRQRAPRRGSTSPQFQTHRFACLVQGLGQLYADVTERRPTAGGQGRDCREYGPFVSLVRAVLSAYIPEEAKRRAVGQTVYELIRKQRSVEVLPD